MATNETKRGVAAVEAVVLPQPSGTPYGLKLQFANGKELQITLSQLSADMREHAAVHGLKQKLVDAAAIPRDPTTGRAATVETKFAAVREVYDRLLAGEWNKRREAGAGGSGGLLFAALSKMYPEKDITAFLAGKSDEEKAALRKNAKVAAVIEEIRAARAAARGDGGPDSDAILGELED